MKWIFTIRFLAVFAVMQTLALSGWAVTPVKSVRELTPDHIGEFVSISGTTEQFRAPSSRKEPYSFNLRDSAGQTIRVCAWPETMTAIRGWQELAVTGTRIHLTAEVRDQEGRLELQIQDWKEVELTRTSRKDGRTTAIRPVGAIDLNHTETTGSL